jgi:uncharacterized protein YqjF (DUF2071 family)
MTTPLPPHAVRRPIVYQDWTRFTALHWRYPPATVARHLPDGLRVQTFDGSAWVSMTPFVMDRVRPPLTPPLRGLSTFPETNVRTYVEDATRRDGLWFFSLEAACLALVAVVRSTYRLPYCWADMAVEQTGSTIRYRSRRRWPAASTATGHDIVVDVGLPQPAQPQSELDVFLMDRWRAYAPTPLGLAFTPVEHEPWPVSTARVERLDETLLAAVGLPPPAGDPLVHYCRGVHARLGPPSLVAKHAVA